MKVRRHIQLSADVDAALEELGRKYGLSRGDIIDAMYHALGGREGLERLLSGTAPPRNRTERARQGLPTLSEIIDSMEPLEVSW